MRRSWYAKDDLPIKVKMVRPVHTYRNGILDRMTRVGEVGQISQWGSLVVRIDFADGNFVMTTDTNIRALSPLEQLAECAE